MLVRIGLVLILFAMTVPSATAELICCGGEEVFRIPDNIPKPTLQDRTWRWRASDSPEIPEASRAWFRSTDDCKQVGENLLISSSSGGVALIRIKDKRCLFLAYAKNAHSIGMLPGNRIAVAASSGGDELQVYAITGKVSAQVAPVAKLPLISAHGVVWDEQSKQLWALGGDLLLLVNVTGDATKTELKILKQWKLPTTGGHDLSPTRDSNILFVTSSKHVYRFDKQKGTFTIDPEFGDLPKVKSITENLQTGEIVYHQATEKNWWSDVIRFSDAKKNITIPGERLYKIRWSLPGKTPANSPAME